MNKLKVISESLKTNPELGIVKEFRSDYFPGRNGKYSHIVEFLVAPKKGLYTKEGLQELMMHLIPEELKPTDEESFRQYCRWNNLSLGRLCFDEELGQERITRSCIWTDKEFYEDRDKDLLKTLGFVNGQRTKEEIIPYLRRIWVRPFPSVDLVEDLLRGKIDSKYSLSQKELRRYRPGFFQRILNRG